MNASNSENAAGPHVCVCAAAVAAGPGRPGASRAMEEDRDFRNSDPLKTVRFGGTVAETLEKHRQVRTTAPH